MIRQAASYGLVVATIVVAANVLMLGITYALYMGYVDTGEPNIVALSWRLVNGNPVYLPIDDAARITNLYGPYLYLIHASVFSVFGASVFIGKLPGIIALVLTIMVCAFGQRGRSYQTVAFAAGCTAAIIMINLPASIWDRPESFMMLSVALGVLLNNSSRVGKWGRVAGFGILIGIVIGLKIFAAIYFLPMGLLMLVRDGFKACVATVILAFAVTALPFLSPMFELQYLLDLIGVMADKPNSSNELLKIVRYSGFYLIPPLVFVVWGWKSMPADEKREAAVLTGGFLLAMLAVMYPAQKPGAGMYYMLPFVVVAFDIAARGLNRLTGRPAALVTALLVCVLLNIATIPAEKRFFRNLNWDMAAGVASEIEGIALDNPGKSIEIGIGDSNESYRRTYQRTRLVFAGHPYSLDTSIVIDTTAWGVEITAATRALIESCKTDIWLVPAGERPFAWIGYYGKDVYGQAFRDSFNSTYIKSESREYFDIYRCRGGG